MIQEVNKLLQGVKSNNKSTSLCCLTSIEKYLKVGGLKVNKWIKMSTFEHKKLFIMSFKFNFNEKYNKIFLSKND